MPMMSGFELVHRLRSDARTIAVPIIVVTSNPDAALTLASAGLVNAIVTKPFTAAAFAESIRDLVRNESGRTVLEAH
jgi:CheY-like chemotaxis protein